MLSTGLISFLVLTLAQMPPVSGIPDLSTHKEIKVEVSIRASADMVWRTLTNFPAYDIWNPYIYPASGEAIAGRKLDLTLRGRITGTGTGTSTGTGSGTGAGGGTGPGPGKGTGSGTVIHFSPTVLVAKPDHELSWGGQDMLGGVQRVATFDIVALGPHLVRLVASERFRGILLPLAQGVTDDSAAGLKSMANALRDRAELLDFSPHAAPVPHR